MGINYYILSSVGGYPVALTRNIVISQDLDLWNN